MTTTPDAPPAPARRWTDRPLWQVGLASAPVAAVAAVAVYAIARAAGVPMELTEVFETTFARMPVINMAFAALLEGGIAGTVLAAACRRWTSHPRTWFLVLTTIGLAASFAFPILSDGSTATKLVLSASHLVVAAIIVPALTLALPRQTSQEENESW